MYCIRAKKANVFISKNNNKLNKNIKKLHCFFYKAYRIKSRLVIIPTYACINQKKYIYTYIYYI